MNRRVLKLALPNIVTNVTVPLLGMVDMAIVGHLSSAHIGAITIGASIFNLIYWNFGFLRMGTSGFTAQAYGAGRWSEALATLVRALAIAFLIALLLNALQWPISRLVPVIFKGSGQVIGMALTYFFVRIWAAPATLGLYAIKGWFIGMQDSRTPMWIAIALNCVNIACSLLFVLVLRWDIAGVALGTVVAQYSGLLLGVLSLRRRMRIDPHLSAMRVDMDFVRRSLRWSEMRLFFKVNGDIFLRTVCLATVFTFITAASGRIGDLELEVDALLLQFFTLFSYIMDGFAYAGESLVGRYIGARDESSLRKSVRLLLVWGLALTAAFTLLYALFSTQFLRVFTSDAGLVESAGSYIGWVLAIPACGFAAFLLDGVFVGATASRTMRNSMFVATAAFFAVYFGLKAVLAWQGALDARMWNNTLWLAFMVYLVLRGVLQGVKIKSDIYTRAE
ncbi:MAG: MATE family efflux transporter [Bacteroidales bacterium]|nr:MATE family efflux transporter [Bacteroidales bacterium]